MHLLDTLDLHHASHEQRLRDRSSGREPQTVSARPGRRRWAPARWTRAAVL